MQQLSDNPNLKPSLLPREPMSEEEIIALRTKYNNGNEFPLAFEEFLQIAGNGSNITVDTDFESLFEDVEEVIEFTGFSIDRPFFPFDQNDSQFSIFFLDEDKPDPDVYIYDPYGKKRGDYPLFRSANGFTFSGLVNEDIRRTKLNLRP